MMIVQDNHTDPMTLKHRPSSDDTTTDSVSIPLNVITTSAQSYIQTKNYMFDCNTQIGLRPTQEDRMVLVPKLFHEEVAFCGVFDGTVGPHASEFLMRNFIDVMLQMGEMQQLMDLTKKNKKTPSHNEVALIIRDCLHKTFLRTDEALLRYCADHQYHYASSTGVTAFLWKDMLTVAHVGDSKACIAKVSAQNRISVEWLTVDHKPNMPHELSRIQQNGGSLVWLHGNKAYIRGGDFTVRQARGEHPKQLNYSRAFGGKDLKMYGLSAEPDINHFEIQPDDKVVLIASDGLWDAVDPILACEIALNARRQGRSAAYELTQRAIRDMPSRNVSDNVSVIAIFF